MTAFSNSVSQHRSRLWRSVALFTSLLWTGGGAAGELGRDWVESMSMAMQQQNYVGTFVYIHDGDVESMRIYHSRIGDVEYERLISLNGEAREIIRDADSVTCIWPGSKSVIVSKSAPRTPFPKFEPDQLRELQLYYEFTRRGSSRVAGRMAEQVDIQPRDAYRYGYRFWIDEDTHLLLRSIMIDDKGRAIEQVMFTEIEYPEGISLEMFNASVTGQHHRWEKTDADEQLTADQAEALPKILASAVPAGFKPISDVLVPVVGSTTPARRTMYSDGLASLSVYLSFMGDSDESALMGGSAMGAVHAYGRSVGKWHVTAVGEVPMETVKMLGESIQPVNEKG